MLINPPVQRIHMLISLPETSGSLSDMSMGRTWLCHSAVYNIIVVTGGSVVNEGKFTLSPFVRTLLL